MANHANVALVYSTTINACSSLYAMYVFYSGNPAVGSVGASPLPDIVLLLSG